MPTSERKPQPNQTKEHDPVERLTANLDDDVAGLQEALRQLAGHQDRDEILRAITAAVMIQELSRMTITQAKMIAGDPSSIDPERLLTDWKVLARHYAGAKHEKFLQNGLTQLEKLTPEQIRPVIHEIRCAIEPTLNWAMEETSMKFGVEIPYLKRTGLGQLRLRFDAPRLTIRRFQGRMIRFILQCGLFLAVAFGTLHWITWTVFNEPLLAVRFDGTAKLAEFLLLACTSLLVWVLCRFRIRDALVHPLRLPRVAVKAAGWLAIAAGWCHFVLWFLFGQPAKVPGLDEAIKLLLPLYLVAGSFVVWLVGSIFREKKLTINARPAWWVHRCLLLPIEGRHGVPEVRDTPTICSASTCRRLGSFALMRQASVRDRHQRDDFVARRFPSALGRAPGLHHAFN